MEYIGYKQRDLSGDWVTVMDAQTGSGSREGCFSAAVQYFSNVAREAKAPTLYTDQGEFFATLSSKNLHRLR